MKKQKHFFLYSIVSLISLVLFASCENKRDNSGTLGGMWKLEKWEDPSTHNLLYNKPDTTIYYKIRSNVFMLQELPGGADDYFLTYYHQTTDSIIINQPYKIVNNKDSVNNVLYVISDLKKYGIPGNGRLHIDLLNSDKMILSGEEGTLHFRKY